MKLFKDSLDGPELGKLYRSIWYLSWPVFVAQGLRSVVMFVSRAIVGQLGDQAFNSVNIGLMIFMVIITVIAAVAVGTTALVAQYWGAGDRKQAGLVLQQSVMWGFMVTVVIAVAGMPLSRLLFHALGADAKTIAQGTEFMTWLFVALPLIAIGFFLAAGLRAAGDTRTPMWAGVIMSLLSLFFTYGLVLGKLGLPRMETRGAALAIDITFFSFTLFLGALFLANKTIIKLPLRGWRPDVKTGLAIFKIGLPSATEWILIQLGILIYIFLIYRYGTEAAAGYFTGIALLTFAQAPSFGFQTAAATLVGQAVGAKDLKRAESVFRHCALLAFGLMVVIGAAVFAVATPDVLARVFGELSAESIDYARTFAVLLVFVMPLMGVSFSMAGGLRGSGDTIPPLIASTVGVYAGRVMIAVIVYKLFHPPIFYIWLSMYPDLIMRILLMAVRIRSGKWKKGRIGKDH
ncbi:MAG: MATE family efflux transporter [bacterium]